MKMRVAKPQFLGDRDTLLMIGTSAPHRLYDILKTFFDKGGTTESSQTLPLKLFLCFYYSFHAIRNRQAIGKADNARLVEQTKPQAVCLELSGLRKPLAPSAAYLLRHPLVYALHGKVLWHSLLPIFNLASIFKSERDPLELEELRFGICGSWLPPRVGGKADEL